MFSVKAIHRPFVARRCLYHVGLCVCLGLVNSNDAKEPPAPSAYAHPSFVIEARELTKAPSRPGSRLIVDVRTAEKFAEGHLQDAVHVVIADWVKDFADTANADQWTRRFRALGIGRDTEVVVYDDRAGQDAARLWWYLRFGGVCQARIVNGGWKSIQAEKTASIVNGPSRAPAVTNYSSPPLTSRRIDLSSVADLVNAKEDKSDRPQLVDTRTEKEFRGLQAAEGVRPGTIPGARHLEWSELVDPSTDRFRTTDEVKKILSERGIDLNRPIILFSNTKGRSSSLSFPLELAGAVQVRVFDAGYKAWAAIENNPVATSN
jgi:thiosulfate/3-mercaptopyruvate sulfurtransferase